MIVIDEEINDDNFHMVFSAVEVKRTSEDEIILIKKAAHIRSENIKLLPKNVTIEEDLMIMGRSEYDGDEEHFYATPVKFPEGLRVLKMIYVDTDPKYIKKCNPTYARQIF